MKLAKLILPLLGNDGRDLFDSHLQVQTILLETWGGYTSIEAIGGWRNGHGKLFKEHVVVYEIAMPQDDSPKLRKLAQIIAAAAKQESVMIVTPGGDVCFEHPQKEAVNAS